MAPLWDEGAFAATLQALQSLDQPMRAQQQATFYTFVGRQDQVGEVQGELDSPSLNCVAGQGNVRRRPGDQWLLEAARDSRVVMLNENHYRVASRAFLLALLESLRELGYTHLGLEAFPAPAAMTARAGGDRRSYSPDDGYYTREPVFAALIRRARELGFEVFGYESGEEIPEGASASERIAIREEAQAGNLASRVNAAGDRARFVVIAGWDHIAEAPLGGDEQRWMAARFREKTGIDPLTVDLTGCAYQVDAGSPPPPGEVALDASGEMIVAGRFEGVVDAQIHMPDPVPSSLATGFYRQVLGTEVTVPEALRSPAMPVLVRARRTDQGPDRTPYDQLLLAPGENLPLYLPSGHEYELVSHRGDGTVMGSTTLRVE